MSSADATLVASFRASALRQWHAAGGDVLERRAQDSHSALEYAATVREAFVLAQTAAALDVHQLSLLRALRELNGSVEALAEASPPVASGAKDGYTDDHSDGSSAQGALVSSNVRPGKPEETFSGSRELHAPDGSVRFVFDGLLSASECARLLGGTLVAMAGAFSQCGQTRLGMSPALAARMGALPAGGGPPLGLLYSTVERVRRKVARAYGADLDQLRVSDATLVRLRAAAEEARDASETGALDVGVLRGDHFSYHRPHIDQISVPEYEYSALLYLARHGEDFDGGRLVFHDPEQDVVLLPEPGTLVAFRSGNTNLHCVERVSRGSRFALTMWFTSSPPPADLDPAHRAMLEWAKESVGAAEAAAAAAPRATADAAPAPPPLTPTPEAVARLQELQELQGLQGLQGQALQGREAELVSASVCSLPANDTLGHALRYAHARGGQVAQTLARGLRLSVNEAHCAPPAAAAAAATGCERVPAEPPSALLRSRLQTHAATAATLQRAQEARAAAALPVAGVGAPATMSGAPAEDDFSCFD